MQIKDAFPCSETERIPDETGEIRLHADDLKLIRLIRSIDFGEIESLKIKNGCAVNYKIAWKKEPREFPRIRR